MNKLFSVHSLENKGFYIRSVRSRNFSLNLTFLCRFSTFLSTSNRDSSSEGVKKLFLVSFLELSDIYLKVRARKNTSIQTSCSTQSSVTVNALVALK